MKFNFCNIPVIVARKARMNIFIERIFSFLLSLSFPFSLFSLVQVARILSSGILKLVIRSRRDSI